MKISGEQAKPFEEELPIQEEISQEPFEITPVKKPRAKKIK